MEGKYPIIIDGAPLGALEVTKNGARTVFKARCRMVEGLLRLSVYGQGKEGYLGVMAPESGELTLTRSLSKLDMRSFPETIDSVGRAGQGRSAPVFASRDMSPAPQDVSPAPQPPQDASPAPQPPQDASPAPQPPQDASPAPQPPQDASPAPRPPQDASPAPQPPCTPEPPCAEPCRPCDLFWYASPDGALVSFDGERNYVALPPGDPRIPENITGQARTIEGREYLVFVTRNGRITL